MSYKHTEISFELNEIVYTKFYSMLSNKYYYKKYTVIGSLLSSPLRISKTKFYTALKIARSTNIKIKTNFITKPKQK